MLTALADPALLYVCPDTAQMAFGDFDLGASFEKYAERIEYVHYKDIAFHDGRGAYLPTIPPRVSEKGAWGHNRSADFLEPGRGVINFRELHRIAVRAGFDGWIVVDPDYPLTTPYKSSLHSA